MPATFYLLRHGETDWNVIQRAQGHEDIPLNDNGRAQARLVAPIIAQLDLGACYSSDLKRAHETAQIALHHHTETLQPIATPALRERHYGRLSGMTPDEAAADRALNPHLYLDHQTRFFAIDGEAPAAFSSRVKAAINDHIVDHDKPILIVSHGGVIREVMRQFLKMTEPPKPGNCHLFQFTGENDDWQMDRIWPQ